MDNKSLSHVRWKCQYHIVFIPKYRKKVLYGKLKADVRDIISTLYVIQVFGENSHRFSLFSSFFQNFHRKSIELL